MEFLDTIGAIFSGFSNIFYAISGTFDLISHSWGWLGDINEAFLSFLGWIEVLGGLFG